MRMLVAAALAGALVYAASSDPRFAVGQEKKDDKKDEKEKKLDKLLKDIEAAAKKGDSKEVIKLSEAGVKDFPEHPAIHFAAGSAHAKLRQHDKAIESFNLVLKHEPKAAIAHDRRGDSFLKLGKFVEAIGDFDDYLKAKPKDEPEHWRRGIAYYYAKEFEKGVKQFDLHKTVNGEDVENSVWHYLCNARFTTPEKAREKLIKVEKDDRVPMKEILEMYKAEIKEPKDASPEIKKVLEAPRKANLSGEPLKEAEFYAHLYVALYYESRGDVKKCREHMVNAKNRQISHYMWDVAAMHLTKLPEFP